MKGYCVDVRGFGEQKKEMVVSAIGTLIGYRGRLSLWDSQERLGNVSRNGVIFCGVAWGEGKASEEQIPHLISFNDLMIEAGFNYEDSGVEDFKCIDWSERAVTENKPASNKTRPRITREQYNSVMAQSDKRTFTKALDDLLAIEKEQLLDESDVRINQLEREKEHFAKQVISWRESWLKSHYAKQEIEAKLEKQKRKTAFVTFCLALVVAAQWAFIFFR